MDDKRADIAVIILTLNEEKHLARALEAVAGWTRSVHVIDCGSTDRTLEIARRFGAEVLSHAWVNYADQFDWALKAIGTEARWVLRLDADEIVEPDLAANLCRTLAGLPADVTGLTLDRQTVFMGRRIRFGGRRKLRMLRLFRRGCGRIERRWMDEHLVVCTGRTAFMPGGFVDHNLGDLTTFIDKHNRYATREAVDVLGARHRLFGAEPLSARTTGWRAALVRWIKLNLYCRLPFGLASSLYFIFRYVICLGFLDGRAGLVYHGLQGFWYRFLVGAKVGEFEQGLKACASTGEKRAMLARLSELDLVWPAREFALDPASSPFSPADLIRG